ncbi:MAG: prepilin peptidase, partial [Patescibacteria group bacterium]|nr:prepilin peptidase [Patescibacteria group bacterium]
ALKGRSICDHCRKMFSWYDNIPLLSYVMLGGKCRRCHKPINPEYPLIELLIGVEFVWIYWLLKINFNFFNWIEGWYSFGLLLYWLVLFSGALAIVVYDLKYMLIPDQVLLPLIVVAFSRLFISQQWSVLLPAFGSLAFLGLLHLLTRGKGMGLGDVKLGFLLGLVLGWPLIIVALFIAFLTGALAGVILIIVRGKTLKTKIAFGPFLLLGMVIAKLWGWSLWHWYFKWW